MRNSNSYPSRRFSSVLLPFSVSVVVCLFASFRVSAQVPSKPLSHYLREDLGSDRGFPGGPINAITQTSDGYLWIGAQKGLVRFDGREFHLFSQSSSNGNPLGPVLGLLPDYQGNLWVRLQGPGLLRYRDGRFEDFTNNFEIPEVAVTQMCSSADGKAVFATIMNGTVIFDQGKFKVIAPPPHIPDFLVMSMALGSDGRYFLGSRDRGLFRIRDGQISAVEDISRHWQVNALLSEGPDHLWIGTDKGLFSWDGRKVAHVGLDSSLRDRQILSLYRDGEGSVWVGTDRGMYRLDPGNDFQPKKENFEDSGPVSAIFEDRERNVWAATSRGLERLRNTVFTTFSSSDGLLAVSNGLVYADADGRTWFAPTKGGLYWFKGGSVGHIIAAGLDRDVVYSLAGGNGDLWIARQLGGLTHLRYSQGKWDAVTYTKKDGMAQDSIFSVRTTHDGTVWAGTLNAGVTRVSRGRFNAFTEKNGLASNTITGILVATDGTIWFATPRGLSGYSNDRWFSFSRNDGLPSDDLNCLFEDSAGVLWVGTANGLAALRSGKILIPAHPSELLQEPIFGIREDHNGFLWISTSSHVLRVNRARLLDPEFNENEIREFDSTDGLRNADGVKRDEAVAVDAAGQVWFSLSRGLAIADANRLRIASPPTILHLERLSADGKPLALQSPTPVPHPQRVTIDFDGLSLSVPERIRFKYELDGFDRDWNGPLSTHQAIYTNLNPGPYLFRVMASNSDGIWNSRELTVSLVIEPVFWRTWWFAAVAVVALILAILGLVRLRLLSVTHQLNVRFEERLAERTRIARELHDTLLQSLHGLMFQFQAARNMLPNRPQEAIHTLDAALSATEQAIAESRGAIHDLRMDPVRNGDLGESLRAAAQELAESHLEDSQAPAFQVIVEGERKPLPPVLQDEAYRIAREILRNAFQHAHADRIEAEIRYGEQVLRLRIRDNGMGINPKVLKEGGTSGHWGLRGVRERAQQIGAKLDFWSEVGAGTEVQLSIPAAVAYETSHDRSKHKRSGISPVLGGKKV